MNQVQVPHRAESGVWLLDLRLLPGLTTQALPTDDVVLDPVAQVLLDATFLLCWVADDGVLRVADGGFPGVADGGFLGVADGGFLRGADGGYPRVADDAVIVLRDGFVERLEILDVFDGNGVEVAALDERAEKGVADDLQQHWLDVRRLHGRGAS